MNGASTLLCFLCIDLSCSIDKDITWKIVVTIVSVPLTYGCLASPFVVIYMLL